MPVLGSTAYNTARKITKLIRRLVNDGGTLSLPVGIVQIQRVNASGVVTVTTATPHNMLAGDFALINGVTVGALSFNGTFAVTNVVSNVQFQYAQAGADETQATGTVQGYGIGTWATDTALMEYVNSAYRMVQRKLANVGTSLFSNDDVQLVVAAVTSPDPGVQVSISDATAPPNQLPVDLVAPLKLWERQNGSADDFNEMVDMTDHGGLPSRPQGMTLEMWEWRGDAIYFIGALVDTQIRLRYRKGLVDLVDGTSTVGIRDATEAIAYPAAIAAGLARGSPLAQSYQALAEDAMEDLISATARREQHSGRRPRPFSRRSGVTPF